MACRTGITPCVSTGVFNHSAHFCVMVKIFPRIIYHPSGLFENMIKHNTRYRREPGSITLAVLMGFGVATGIGTGTVALIQGSHQMTVMQAAIDQDLKEIETSVTALQTSLTSLSEVVLQNRRGIDLLFMKEGGLCAALKEECCFYADHSRVVKESMTKLREHLRERQKEWETRQGWFESWFTQSPWLTTLLSALAGPLVILLLIITIGPCVLNRVSTFYKDKLKLSN